MDKHEISIGIKPFNDYWMTCKDNNHFSILSSLEPSYRNLAYLNCYSYKVTEYQPRAHVYQKRLEVEYMSDAMKDFYGTLFVGQPFMFKSREKEKLLKEIKDLIKRKNIFLVSVDLFYWIPNSFCWQKRHWEHYSLVTGYHEKKEEFYVFDDDMEGYGLHIIPEERFYDAIKNFIPRFIKDDGMILQLKKELKPVEIPLELVLLSAERLVKEIRSLNPEEIWVIQCQSDDDFQDLIDQIVIRLTGISNRHKGNEFLFKALFDPKLIEDAGLTSQLIQYSRELQEEWTTIKNLFQKMRYVNDREAIFGKIKNLCRLEFEKEVQMWEVLLNHKQLNTL